MPSIAAVWTTTRTTPASTTLWWLVVGIFFSCVPSVTATGTRGGAGGVPLHQQQQQPRRQQVLTPVTGTTAAHSTPDSPDWPSADVWQTELADLLSPEASLLGPFFNDSTVFDICERAGTNAYARIFAATGVCMQGPTCHYQFCRPDIVGQNLTTLQAPAYVLDPRTPEDISVAVQFAGRFRIPVSVKNTGHTSNAGSLARDALLIWMPNFPKDDMVTTDFQDSCGDQNYTVVGIGGGELFDDVLDALGSDYHLVTGACRSVGYPGWLQGVGLSYTARRYGLGVDNVVALDVVLPNGDFITADACTNPDIFYALRGGGGGTFGVVTHMDYRIHPVTPIIYIQWQLGGLYNRQQFLRHTKTWFDFLLNFVPRLDERWGGNFDSLGVDLYFTGTLEEARASFLDEFDLWFEQEYIPMVNPGLFWGVPRPSSIAQVFDSWFNARGGAAAFRDPDSTPAQGGDIQRGLTASRLITAEFLEQNRDALLEVMVELEDSGELSFFSSYILGGNIRSVDKNETAVHPVMRDAVMSLHTSDNTAGRRLRDLIPPNQTGVSYNHHSAAEPEWRETLWGGLDRYETLLAVKDQVDPNRVLNCWHCVGYVGDEIDADELGVENEPPFRCFIFFFSFCLFPFLNPFASLFRFLFGWL